MRKISVLASFIFGIVLFPPFALADGGFEAKGVQIDLDSLISRSLANHGQIECARARIEKEEALLRAAGSRLFPQATVDAYAGREFVPGDRGDFFGGAALRLSLFEGGKHFHEKKRQALIVDQEKFHQQEDELETIYQIKALYLNTLKEAGLLKSAQEWVRETGRHYRILKILREKDLVLEAELLRASSLSEEAQLELLRHKEAYDYGLALLRELLRLAPNERLILEPLTESHDPEIAFDSIIDGIRKAYPLYKILPLRVNELEAEKRILLSERLPEISFVTRFYSPRIDFDQNRYEAGLQGSWNIWDWKATSNQIKAKEAEIREVKAENKIKLMQWENEIRKKISDYKIQKRNTDVLETYLKEARKKYENEKMKFSTGRNSGFDVIDSFIQLKKAQIERVGDLFEMQITFAQIESLAGLRLNNSDVNWNRGDK
ncbi:MAG: TolC family protein [Candidatus Omnitrophica bacterium]|nr:TolC family protein [Candidatus Omnitrophota bacterium]